MAKSSSQKAKVVHLACLFTANRAIMPTSYHMFICGRVGPKHPAVANTEENFYVGVSTKHLFSMYLIITLRFFQFSGPSAFACYSHHHSGMLYIIGFSLHSNTQDEEEC